jgi:hypothetical protein
MSTRGDGFGLRWDASSGLRSYAESRRAGGPGRDTCSSSNTKASRASVKAPVSMSPGSIGGDLAIAVGQTWSTARTRSSPGGLVESGQREAALLWPEL